MPLNFAPVQRLRLACGPLAYRHQGEGLPLLLIHGWRGSSRYWHDTQTRLADIRAVYALDLPGHGETPPRQAPTSTESLARLVIDFADRRGLARFDLNGHSLGAAVAVQVAARWPERVSRLVLTSLGTARSALERWLLTQTHQQMQQALQWWRPWLVMGRPLVGLGQPLLDWLGSQPALYRALAGAFVHRLPEDDELTRMGVLEFLRADPLTALEGAISAGSPSLWQSLERVTAPTLLLSADQDPIMPDSGALSLARRLANCRLVRLTDCGHIPMVEQPEVYHRLVRDFLLEAAPARA